MKLNVVQKRRYGILLAMALLIVCLFAGAGNIYAQDKPAMPVLSLTGSSSSWADEWYPDGRIWLPVSSGEPREFLLPVFVTNRWHTYEETKDIYYADPIYSFSFKVLYDSSALRAVGVQAFGPKDQVLGLPYAHGFNLDWMDDRDLSYKTYLNTETPDQDKWKGRAIKIAGTSTKPLPNTDLYSEEWKVLLYIRFRVVPTFGTGLGTAQATPIYIKNDTIMYNDLNVRAHAPFERLRPEWRGRVVADDYGDPSEFTGLAGVINRENTQKWSTEPYLPGVIYLRLSDKIPQFDFRCERGIGQVPALNKIEDWFWDMKDPITLDSASFDPFIGSRTVQVLNGTPASRMLDVEVESDQPWLTFRTKVVGTTSKNPIPATTRKGYINWIDNGILGDGQRGTPIAGRETTPDGEIHLEIRCDPANLDPAKNAGEAAGIYVGYITFKSSTALISPVRMRVTFIYFRNPVEWYNVNKTPGIHMTVRNSRGAVGDAKNLIFGTGHRATTGVDSLFGEFAYEYPMRDFDVRWFVPPSESQEQQDLVPNGFGDFNSNDELHRSNSRDIRNVNDTMQSIIYYCKINEDTAAHYPLIVEWDVADFMDGATYFLRDMVNGAYFPAVDMRRATNIGGTRYAFTIEDARVKEFVIEYTLPRVINYVDAEGNPIIKKGWNLLSLPVRPTNSNYKVFYPNAINRPYFFSQNQYQDEDVLRVGTGYYIKYGTTVDKQFAGTYISEIANPLDPIRLYPGWNTIGCVSSSVNVRDIQFTNFYLSLPTQAYTRKAGVWGYKTNNGYIEVSELEPGLGYWLKVDNDGYYWLKANNGRLGADNDFISVKQNVLATTNAITLRDNAQHETNLYFTSNKDLDLSYFELPPAPPVEMFDARLNNGSLVSNEVSSVIRLQGITYPIALQVNNSDAQYVFVDAVSNEVLGTIAKGASDKVEIKGTKSNAIKVLKSDVVTGFGISNYPNPVQNSSTVSYSIPESGNVSIKLYDMLGFEVATLENSFRTVGSYTVTLNAANLANGTYICKIVSGNNTAVQTVTVTK